MQGGRAPAVCTIFSRGSLRLKRGDTEPGLVRPLRLFPCNSVAMLRPMELDSYWRTGTISEAQAQGYSHLRATCSGCGRISDLPWPLLIGRRGTTRETFLGNIPLRCQRCGNTAPIIDVRHHDNTAGYAKPSFRDSVGDVVQNAGLEPRIGVTRQRDAQGHYLKRRGMALIWDFCRRTSSLALRVTITGLRKL